MPIAWQKQLDNYRGLAMRCAPGTHEAAAALLLRHVNPGPALPVLDLAAGSGAFLARLRDAGFADLHALELDRAAFKVAGVEPLAADLNAPFAATVAANNPRAFGLICAIEIVEHLDNPRHLLREARALLAPGGHLLLSTPNVANWLGRLRFLISGELRPFRENDYHFQRHVSPITDVQMRLMLREVGFELKASVTAGNFFAPPKRALLAPIRGMARLLWGEMGVDDVRIYLARRAEPDATAHGRDSRYFER